MNNALMQYNPTPIEPQWVAQQRAAQMQGAQRNALMQQMQYEDALQQRQAQAQQQQKNALMQQVRQRELGAMNSGAGPAMPFDPQRLIASGAFSPAEVKTMGEVINPERKLHNVGNVALDARTGQPVYTAPEKNPFADQLRAAGIDPNGPQGRQMALDKLKKDTTHAPAATAISYGSPVPVDLGGGKIGYAQPGNRPGAAPQMMTGQDGKPLVKPIDSREKDLTEASAKATTYLGQMRSATKALQDLKADQTALSVQAETALAGGPMNVVIRDKAQRIRQSQDQWSEAFLRFKTGAASTPEEVAANRKTFFPTVGDKPETVQQKAAMRLSAEKDMEIAAGRGTKQLTEPASSTQAAPSGWKIERVN